MFRTNLVQTTTSTDLILSGLLNRPAIKNETAVIYIHGFLTDFFTHTFVHKIAEASVSAGIAFLSIQTQGTGIYTEILKTNRIYSKIVGSYFELVEDAVIDIDAWIDYLKTLGYSQFILIGHSLGTYKVVRYLLEGIHRKDIIKASLLGPFDKNAFLERKSGKEWPQHVLDAKVQVDAGKGLEIVPTDWEDYPMSYQTFYSWYRSDEVNEMWDFYRGKSFSFPVWDKVKIPIQVVSGTKDESLDYSEFYARDEAYEIMRARITDLDLQLIEGSGHCFVGYEEKVAECVKSFLLK